MYISEFIYSDLQRIIVKDILETRFLTGFKNNQGTIYTFKYNRGSASFILDLPNGSFPSA
jgi:hypothetical protein